MPHSPSPSDQDQETRLLRLRPAARRLDIVVSYLSRLMPRLEADGVTVERPAPGVVLIDERGLVEWWKSWHPEWKDPQQGKADTP